MATLNIKNFPDPLHKRLRATAKRNRRSLSQEVVQLLEEGSKRHSIMELQGVGKEFWQSLGMDAAEYIRKERDAWD